MPYLYNLKTLLPRPFTYKKIIMTRNSFVKLFVVLGTFLTAPFSVIAKPFSKKRIDKGIEVDAGKDRFGESISLFQGDTFFTKVSTKDTDGDLHIFESIR